MLYVIRRCLDILILILISIDAIMLFISGFKLSQLIKSYRTYTILLIVFIMLSIPAVLYMVIDFVYYINKQYPIWYINFRSINGTEYLSISLAIFLGFVTPRLFRLKNIRWNIFRKYLLFLYAIVLLLPFAGPIVLPFKLLDSVGNRWNGDVCIQTTRATCAPASLATILRHYKIYRTEEEMAYASHSSLLGTDLWYLIRAANKNGLKTNCRYAEDLYSSNIRMPALAVVTIKDVNEQHMIVLLGKHKNRLIIADPMSGKSLLTKTEFNNRYNFDNLVIEMSVSKP